MQGRLDMDLWEKFGMDEKITTFWKELGISAGTAIVILIALYFVIKWAVKNGILEAHKKIAEQNVQNSLKAAQTGGNENAGDDTQ